MLEEDFRRRSVSDSFGWTMRCFLFSKELGWVSGLLALALFSSSCSPIASLALRPFYTPSELALESVEVRYDVAYVEDARSGRQALDLYKPRADGWPALVFVHGGSLTRGDKALVIGRHDIYRNIGRFYAQKGIGVAVVNYRLQPEATWRDQVDDVRAAIRFTVEYAREHGGSGRVVVSGHSAGGWLAAHAVLGQQWADPLSKVEGIILLSGSGFDLEDARTWDLYPEEEVWSERMKSEDPSVDWKQAASVVPLVRRADPERTPRFLLLHSENEIRALQRQNRILFAALRDAEIDSELFTVAQSNHRRTVLAMSREKSEVAQKVLRFVGRGQVSETSRTRPEESGTKP